MDFYLPSSYFPSFIYDSVSEIKNLPHFLGVQKFKPSGACWRIYGKRAVLARRNDGETKVFAITLQTQDLYSTVPKSLWIGRIPYEGVGGEVGAVALSHRAAAAFEFVAARTAAGVGLARRQRSRHTAQEQDQNRLHFRDCPCFLLSGRARKIVPSSEVSSIYTDTSFVYRHPARSTKAVGAALSHVSG